jgi:dTDP-4-dehydrorhamnose reductase
MQIRGIDRKLLILGASGFVGSNLIRRWERPLLGTYLTRPVWRGIRFDIARERLRDHVLRPGHGFTHAVLTHGMTKLEHCARMRQSSAAINVTGTLRAIDDLLEAGVHPIFLSSDAVFDGEPGLRSEWDQACPILFYGRDKHEVEVYLMGQAQPWTVLRLTKVIASFTDPRNLLSQWLDEIARKRPIRCATDQFLTPVDIEYVTQAICFVIATGAQGVFHLAGSELVTRYELLQYLLARLPEAMRRTTVVRPCSLDEFAGIEPLPHHCGLSNHKFVSLSGITPRPLQELCAALCASVFPEPDFALQSGA